eukprot:symbB.v1.2.034009.t1/scaffold4312.1/size41503/5
MRLNPQAFFISDADAQRCTFHLRGASGIRPCFRCKNIVAKGYGAVDAHGFFKEISCPQYSQLLISSDAETFQSIDHLSTIRTAKQLDNLEKSRGINFRPFSFWNDRAQRNRLPPSHVLGDPMHIFWANGCMSAEINLFMAAFQTTVGDINILINSLNGIPFQTGGHKGHSAHVKRMLSAKLFQGPLYKGSARQCSSVMWLLWYAIQKLLIGRGILVKEIQSFSAAKDICRTLDRFTYSTEVVQSDINLYLHQVDRHQALFNVAYPDDCIASTSSSSTADAAVIASAPSASAPVAESLEDKVARLKECLSEASTTGKLAAVLGAMPKKTEIPKAEVAEKEEKKDPMKKEEKKDPEDPGSGVDWGDESAKEEESSSVYEEIVEEEAADPSSVPAPAADSGAVDPPRNLSGTRRSRKVISRRAC